MGTVLAGLNVSLLQLPVEVRERMRVIRVPKGAARKKRPGAGQPLC